MQTQIHQKYEKKWRGYSVDSTEEQRIISLCTGYGGLELGIRRAGGKVRTVVYSEIEAYAVANLVSKIEKGYMDAAPIWSNLKTFPARQFHGKIHGIIGGYPCQPFSVAGQRKGVADERHLWPYIADHIRVIRPVWCFFENVEGHLSLGFREVKRELEEMGYRVEAGVFSAREVGASHQRKRLFILGNTEHYGLHGREIARSATTTIRDSAEGQDTTSQLAGASESTELAYAHHQRSQGRDSGELQECAEQWPSRPGSPQFSWEAPRTTEPRLGGTANGSASRVDRLRLLGNGVVPATAAKAWTELNRRFVENP